MNIVVFGAGSLGSLVGGLLARVHEVTLVTRTDHVDAIEADGLRIEGVIDDHVYPSATTDGDGLEADLAIVTVKSFDTAAAAHALATGTFDVVCSLQNGMGNEEVLAEHLEPAATVLAGTATYGAIRRGPGLVECTGHGEITLGSRDGEPSPAADRVGEAFTTADIDTTVADDMPHRLWTKLAVNAGINAVTALARVENGAVLDPPAAALARQATRETARTARAYGVPLSNREALASLESVADATAGNTSSMLQDVRTGRRTEVDAINGYVVDGAEARGLDASTNRTLTALLRTWERDRGLR